MNLFHALILSFVEGFTEFLPISSTGHLILVSKLLGLTETNFLKTFEIVIQLGAILAVVTLYSQKLLTSFSLLKKLAVAFMPTAVVGFTLYPLIKGVLLGSSTITLLALFWGGIVLICVEFFLKKQLANHTTNCTEPTFKQALLIGVFQSLSVVPGVSRAAATIVGGLLTGLNRSSATEFSFLLAIPTMFAATGLDIWKSRHLLTSGWVLTMFFGTVFSYIFALMAIKFLIGFVKKHDFTVFGIYRIALAILFWILVK